nr:immunoglobulin heavy chain junction region [Macaca mulatta]
CARSDNSLFDYW